MLKFGGNTTDTERKKTKSESVAWYLQVPNELYAPITLTLQPLSVVYHSVLEPLESMHAANRGNQLSIRIESTCACTERH